MSVSPLLNENKSIQITEAFKNAKEALEDEDTAFPDFLHNKNEHIQKYVTNSIKFCF